MIAPSPNVIDLTISRAMDGCPDDAVTLLVDLLTAADPYQSAREMAIAYGLSPSAFRSRWERAGLPPMKVVMSTATLTRAAWLAQNPDLTCAEIARRSHASWPQVFHRFVRTFTGLSVTDWRASVYGTDPLAAFVGRIITPYLDQWRVAVLTRQRHAA